jgi:LPXTG-motif cell wall-anchored protein
VFWRRKKEQVEQVVDEVTATATDLAEKTATIGPTGVLLLLGAAAVGAAATYYVTRKRRKKKAD